MVFFFFFWFLYTKTPFTPSFASLFKILENASKYIKELQFFTSFIFCFYSISLLSDIFLLSPPFIHKFVLSQNQAEQISSFAQGSILLKPLMSLVRSRWFIVIVCYNGITFCGGNGFIFGFWWGVNQAIMGLGGNGFRVDEPNEFRRQWVQMP